MKNFSEFRKNHFLQSGHTKTFKIAFLELNSDENVNLLGKYCEDSIRALCVIEKVEKTMYN